jgi:hypothetical protein
VEMPLRLMPNPCPDVATQTTPPRGDGTQERAACSPGAQLSQRAVSFFGGPPLALESEALGLDSPE